MNNTITMYELLGMVKDGKAPKKIKWEDQEWEYNPINDYEGIKYGGCLLNQLTLDMSGSISLVNCAYKINEIIDYLKSERK